MNEYWVISYRMVADATGMEKQVSQRHYRDSNDSDFTSLRKALDKAEAYARGRPVSKLSVFLHKR